MPWMNERRPPLIRPKAVAVPKTNAQIATTLLGVDVLINLTWTIFWTGAMGLWRF